MNGLRLQCEHGRWDAHGIRSKTGPNRCPGGRSATAVDLGEMGYVKRDPRWRYCPLCGRRPPPSVDAILTDPEPMCLPTNCPAWIPREP